MKIYGLDFTSAPSRQKPITLAGCSLTDNVLRLASIERLPNFDEFEHFLRRDGPWVTGMDFAFGQPLKLIDNLNFPRNWQQYVELIESMGKREWVRTVDRYIQPREMGDKLHLRVVDELAGAQSPMKMYFIPVGRMFYEGARRLAASQASVLPNRPTDDQRIVLEVYPALVVRKLIGRGSKYKSDDKTKQTELAHRKRADVLSALAASCRSVYGFALDMPPHLRQQMINDPSGDTIDALLSAVQAGWAYTQRAHNYGIPPEVDTLEGWIVDPELLEKYHA